VEKRQGERKKPLEKNRVVSEGCLGLLLQKLFLLPPLSVEKKKTKKRKEKLAQRKEQPGTS